MLDWNIVNISNYIANLYDVSIGFLAKFVDKKHTRSLDSKNVLIDRRMQHRSIHGSSIGLY